MKALYSIEDWIGKKINSVTILKSAGLNKQGRRLVEVECDCGTVRNLSFYDVMTEHSKSCGCKRDAFMSSSKSQHGLSGQPLHQTWVGMRHRCSNEKSSAFHRYGGRGISVCQEWDSFMKFYEWAIANGWKDGLDLDRKNNDEGCSANNCRWVTHKVNCNNRGNTMQISYKGEVKGIGEWASLYGFPTSTIRQRINLNWDLDKVFNTPIKSKKSIA